MKYDNMNIVLYGAGAQNVRRVCRAAASIGLNIIKIVDKDIQKQNTSVFGIDVAGPEWLAELDKKGDPYIVVITARTPKTVAGIQQELIPLKNLKCYSTDEFVASTKAHGKVEKIVSIQIDLVNHCNLSCVRCVNFSPLVEEPSYLKEELFERDVKKLSELTNGDVISIGLLGGEPLLHPQINHFPPIIRKYFPDTEIDIVTNGIKLPEMSDDFFNMCRKFKVHFLISQYPIRFDYDRCLQMLKEKGITTACVGNSGNAQGEQPKMMNRGPLKLDGVSDAQASFNSCSRCTAFPLRNGRLYPCTYAAHIDIFNKYFHKDLPGSKVNGVDLFSVKDLRELTEKISQPIPLCTYCDPSAPVDSVPWSATKRDISEWTLSDD